MDKPKAISLFCGAGGCSLGFLKAGYQILYATDIDPVAIETYRANFPETPTEVADVRSLDFSRLLEELKIERGQLDILIGGPPCQGFSTAGTRFWNDPRNQLLKEYVRSLDEIQPKWFLMENVEGLLTSNKGEYVLEASKAFIQLGYKIRVEKVYSHEYGVPQRRKRVFIIGNRMGHDFELPPALLPLTGKIFGHSSATLMAAIGGLPNAQTDSMVKLCYDREKFDQLEAYFRAGNQSKVISDHHSRVVEGIQLERIKSLKPGQTMKDLPTHLQHKSFMRRAQRRVSDGTPTEKRGGAPSGLKRLHPDRPCLTITGAAIRELIHPVHHRPLTIRECARIQTFPDHFRFEGSQGKKIQQIGNAIPPLLAKTFGEHLKGYFGNPENEELPGELLGYSLSKSTGMSPALIRTKKLLDNLQGGARQQQLEIF